ncbi:MAG: 2-amino-4-hydroxy-6-hydroxymethyldihydropteridine diphosphokinase [Nitrospirota bacterium]
MPIVFIGIGSNLGKREKNCEDAICLLEKNSLEITERSSMIETEPWGITEQPKFINMAIKAKTDLGPGELLKLFKKIESETGRQPGTRWGPRAIDLDILFYDDLIFKSAELEIPHPGIAEREFVLKPLAEIAPDRVHPVLKKSISELLDNISR